MVALDKGGANIAAADALSHVFGYAVGNDPDAPRSSRPRPRRAGGRGTWRRVSTTAPCCRRSRPVVAVGHPASARIWLSVNGEARQEGDIADMIWPVADAIAELSAYVELRPGDLIYTGTPAGWAVSSRAMSSKAVSMAASGPSPTRFL